MFRRNPMEEEKAKFLKEGFKLFCAGKFNSRNGVGIIVDENLKNKIVEVKSKNDRIIMTIKKS